MEDVEEVVSDFVKLPSPRKLRSQNVDKSRTTTNLLPLQHDPHTIVIPRGSTVSGTFTTTQQMTVQLPYRSKSKGGKASRRYSHSSKRKSKRTKRVRIV